MSRNFSIMMASKDFMLELVVRGNPDMSHFPRHKYQIVIQLICPGPLKRVDVVRYLTNTLQQLTIGKHIHLFCSF